MERSGRKSEMMKPILLKAGIPFALSLAGFIFSMITSRRKLHNNTQFRDQESSHGLDSTSLPRREEEEQFIANAHIVDSLVSLQNIDKPELEEEILGLKCTISALQDREQEFETRIIRYCDLKVRELVLTEYRNMLVLEIAHVEFLGMMVESMVAEKRRFDAMVVEYLKMVEQIESARSENVALQMKVKMLLRKTRESSRVLHRRASVLRAKEDEILRSKEELVGKAQVINELEDEIVELKRVVEQLQEEKKEFAEKLNTGETSASSALQIKAEETTMDDQDQLLTELEQLRKDREAEVQELIYLQPMNGSLRHELTSNQEQQRPDEEDKGEKPEYDLHGSSTVTEYGENSMAVTTISHKKAKLLHKLRRLVKGSKEEHHEHKCKSSVSDEAAQHIDPRKSCFCA